MVFIWAGDHEYDANTFIAAERIATRKRLDRGRPKEFWLVEVVITVAALVRYSQVELVVQLTSLEQQQNDEASVWKESDSLLTKL